MFCLPDLSTEPSFHIVAGRDDVVGAPVSWRLGVESAEEV